MKMKKHTRKIMTATLGMASAMAIAFSCSTAEMPGTITEVYAADNTVELIGPPESDEIPMANPTADTPKRVYWPTKDEEEMLMTLAMAEAEAEDIKGKALVIAVVMNRVKSPDFPDDIEGVIFQKNQFQPLEEGGRYWTVTADSECREALELVEHGWDESQGARFFEATWCTSTWHRTHLEYLFTHGGHKFYK